MERTSGLDAAGVLSAVRRHRAEVAAAEVRVLRDVLAWAALHQTVDLEQAAAWGDDLVPIAGTGAPLVSEFCIAELGAAMGTSTDAARSFLADALELAYRLPRIHARVEAGELPVWRARRIAQQTVTLSEEAAAYVDVQLAPFAHRSGPVVTERLVAEAIARFMPELVEETGADGADGRYLRIDHDHARFTGNASVTGTIDVADALDLEAALQAGAATLRAAGSEDSLDVRRAAALGELARGHSGLGLETARTVELVVHLPADFTDGGGGATLEAASGQVVSRDQVAAWCGAPGARVVVRPVIDLAETLTSPGYVPGVTLHEQVILRDRTCVFPWCNRSARRCDLDHVVPWEPGGSTSSDNLAPLCRRHHRLKTHGSWTYTVVDVGTYLWRSPHGHSYLRDRSGTQDLTPRPVEPPGSPPGS